MAKLLSTSDLQSLLRITQGNAVNITGVAAAASVVTVTATAHGLAVGDYVVHANIGGAVEANGLFRVATVPTSGTYTLEGITAVTTYTSGGTLKKVSQWAGDLTPGEIADIADALSRRYHVRGTDADRTGESRLASVFSV